MYVLYAQFTSRPGHESDVRQLVDDFAKVVRREPGNEAFEVYEQSDLPGEFFVFEKYTDEGAFKAHLGAQEGRAFNDALVAHIVGDGSRLTHLHEV